MSVSRTSTPLTSGVSKKDVRSCPVCHDLDRNKIIYWKGGPSRHKMFKRYFQYSDYHSLPIPLKDLKFSASRECQLCVIVFDIFRWLARTKSHGLNTIHQAKVEICVPFDAEYPLVLTFSWLPGPSAPIPRQYDLQLSVPSKSLQLPWATMNVGQQLPSEPRQSIFRPRAWLQTCLQNHSPRLCNTATKGIPRVMPKRLICIGNNQNQIRLVDDFKGKNIPYLALSYCWGQSEHVVTKSFNYEKHLRNIPWHSLPATYRDAVDFVRAVGYRYIWIDALCIMQDDLNDWNSEAARMADIYSEAILVISAANANHVGFGFFNERPGSRTFKNKLQKCPDDPTHVLVQEPTMHINILGDPTLEQQWPVFRRAWTLQERILATRLVHFAAGEVIWECASMCACECGHLEATNAVTSRKRYDLSSLELLTVVERANRWDELALSYQNRHISKDKDRLSALSGLAHRFQSESLGSYLAGLWSNFTLGMLLWEVKQGRKTTEYVAPSWSWASVQGRLTRNDAIQHNCEFKAILEEAYCAPATTDLHGAINPLSGFIRLCSPAVDGVIVRDPLNGHPMIQLTTELQAFLVADVPIVESQIGGTVKCLFLRGLETGSSGRYVEALVLTTSRNLVDFERLGVAHIPSHSFDENNLLRAEVPLSLQTVKII